jgi:hypothetical protein
MLDTEVGALFRLISLVTAFIFLIHRTICLLKGFKETPITAEAWLAAVRACAELDVKEEKNRFGQIRYSVTLKDHKERLHC